MDTKKMMIAGRVGMVYKGVFSDSKSYSRLDSVTYKNSIYIAKKDSTGILPTDEEYWILSITGQTGNAEDIAYDSAESGLNADNVQEAINELAKNGGGGTGGTSNYDDLENQPSIGGVTLQGDKTLSELGIQPEGDYALASNAGHSLFLSIDPLTYIMTLSLLNESGEILSTKTIDFPLESMVVNAEYSLGTLTLILQNGQSVDVDVSDIVYGLVKDTFTIAGINMKDNITAEELRTALGVQNIPNVATNDQIPTFSQTTERTNISSGEKLSVILGKIKKWFSDLKAVAFSGSWNDLSDRPIIPTVGNGKITINQAGVKKGEFTTNQSGDVSVNLDGGSNISLTNNLLATVSGVSALDAAVGPVIQEQFDELNDKLGLETRENPNDSTQAQWKNSNGDWVNFRKALVKVGQASSASATINISYIDSYEYLTNDDFIIVMVSCTAVLDTSRAIANTLSLNPQLTYNGSTGVITVSDLSKSLTGWNGVSYNISAVVDVYMVK